MNESHGRNISTDDDSLIKYWKSAYSPADFQLICKAQVESMLNEYRNGGGIKSLKRAANFFDSLSCSFSDENGLDKAVRIGSFSGASGNDAFAELSVYLRGDLVCIKGANGIEMTHEEAEQLGECLKVAAESLRNCQ